MASFPGNMPTEVIFLIIKNLSKPLDLYNSLLTCRNFRTQAERVLYDRISLVLRGDQFQPLVLTCCRNNRLAGFVRSLAVYSYPTDAESASNPPMDGYNLLDYAIPNLIRLESLAIDPPSSAYFNSPNLRSARQYGYLESLTHVFIEHYQLPQGINFLAHFLKLKSIKELRANFMKDRSRGPSGRPVIGNCRQTSTLTLLELTWCNLHSRTLKRLLRFCSCLKIFRYQHMNGEGYHAFDSDAFGKALLHTRNTLEELWIGVDIHDAPAANEDSDDEETDGSDNNEGRDEGGIKAAENDSGREGGDDEAIGGSDEEIGSTNEEFDRGSTESNSGGEEANRANSDVDDWHMKLGSIDRLTLMTVLKRLRLPICLMPRLVPKDPFDTLWLHILPSSLESLIVDGCDYDIGHIKLQLRNLLCRKGLGMAVSSLKEVVLTDKETPWDCVKALTADPSSGPKWVDDSICIRPVDLIRLSGLRKRLEIPSVRCEWVLSYFDDLRLMSMMEESAVDFRLQLDPVFRRRGLLFE